MAANSSALSSRGTPAAGSSSSSTDGLVASARAISEQPLLAVGQLARGTQARVLEPQRGQDGVRLVERLGIGRQPPPEVARHALPLAHRECHRLQRVEMREQRVDLEGAHQPALDALVRLERGDVLRAQVDAAVCRAAACR